MIETIIFVLTVTVMGMVTIVLLCDLKMGNLEKRIVELEKRLRE